MSARLTGRQKRNLYISEAGAIPRPLIRALTMPAFDGVDGYHICGHSFVAGSLSI